MLKFPFTDTFGCGPFVVDDCYKKIPKIKFDWGHGKWYQVESISPYEENGIQLPSNISFGMLISKKFSFDIKLQNQLSCESISNLSLPNLTYASFQIDSSLTTIYKCNHSVDFPEPSFNFISYKKCPDFKIYYPKKDNASVLRSLRNCSIVKLPLNTNNDHDDIFRMSAANFSLNVSIWPDCHLCHLRGGECKECIGEEGKKPPPGPQPPVPPPKRTERHKGSRSKPVGDGGFGTVHYGMLRDGREVAVKRLHERNYHKRGEINLAKLAVSKIQRSAFDELIDPCLGYQSDEEVKRMTTSVAELAFLCLQQDSELRPPMDEVLEELKRIDSPQEESHFLKENYDNA
ncbi:hypothetical protein GH714_019043 [Hevea brasiliensis]|uniref:Protein kinase domain-containing protein n=1 Tax=Hevea brasiliensis TaxID=3981 RepID=A0A6A6ND87_HEVBR|nr:hypothetical protein GH714_019043 [Hevea brasiliensis]